MLCAVLIWSLLVAPMGAKRIGGSSVGRSHGGAHYPHSTGLSGNTNSYRPAHTYPHSTGLSGNYQHSANPKPRPQVHHHYHYNPPTHISYGATQHPVYRGSPPVYVYEYRNSGSRYDSLLTGLALYNLGRMSASHDHHYTSYDSDRGYRSPPGDVCNLRIERSTREYEETRIDCRLISSFIMEAPRETNNVVHTVTSTVNVTQTGPSDNGTNSNIAVTTTVRNTTVVDALSVKGPSLHVTSGMQCFVIRLSRYGSNLKKSVDCGLLQEYARRSMMYSSSHRILPDVAIYVVVIYIKLYYYLFAS